MIQDLRFSQQCGCIELFDPEDSGTVILHNISSSDTTVQSTRHEF
jgi:hypothetical protein